MPYRTRKVRGKDCYKVYIKGSRETLHKKRNKGVFSSCTSKENAMKQMRLLRALKFNKKFIPNSSRRRRTVKKRPILNKTKKFAVFDPSS